MASTPCRATVVWASAGVPGKRFSGALLGSVGCGWALVRVAPALPRMVFQRKAVFRLESVSTRVELAASAWASGCLVGVEGPGVEDGRVGVEQPGRGRLVEPHPVARPPPAPRWSTPPGRWAGGRPRRRPARGRARPGRARWPAPPRRSAGSARCWAAGVP